MKTLAIGLPASGLTSKVCIPTIAASEAPTIYFGRELDSEAVKFLNRSGKKIIDVPSVAILREYEQHGIQSLNVYCVYNKGIYINGTKPNITNYLDLIQDKYLVVIDELRLFDLDNIVDLFKITQLVVTEHTIRYGELSSFLSEFHKIQLLSRNILSPEECEYFNKLKNIKPSSRLVPYYLNEISNYFALELWESLSNEYKSILETSIKSSLNILICSSAGGGKTTALQSLTSKLEEIHPNSRISIMQQADEITSSTKNTKNLVSSNSQGKWISEIQFELNNCNPNHLVIGELRSSEIKAIFDSEKPWISSIYANSVLEALKNIQHYSAVSTNYKPTNEFIANNVNVVVLVEKFKIVEISYVLGYDDVNQTYQLRSFFVNNDNDKHNLSSENCHNE